MLSGIRDTFGRGGLKSQFPFLRAPLISDRRDAWKKKYHSVDFRLFFPAWPHSLLPRSRNMVRVVEYPGDLSSFAIDCWFRLLGA